MVSITKSVTPTLTPHLLTGVSPRWEGKTLLWKGGSFAPVEVPLRPVLRLYEALGDLERFKREVLPFAGRYTPLAKAPQHPLGCCTLEAWKDTVKYLYSYHQVAKTLHGVLQDRDVDPGLRVQSVLDEAGRYGLQLPQGRKPEELRDYLFNLWMTLATSTPGSLSFQPLTPPGRVQQLRSPLPFQVVLRVGLFEYICLRLAAGLLGGFRVCPVCGTLFLPRRENHTVCSQVCKNRATRKRKP